MGLVIAVLFISLEAVLTTVVLDSGTTLTDNILNPDPREAYHHMLILALIIAFTASVQVLLNRERDFSKDVMEGQARYKALVESTFDGVLVHQEGRIHESNDSLASMFGYSKDEITGMETLDLVDSGSKLTVVRNIEACSEVPYEVKGRRKDGTAFDIRIVNKNITYHGNPARISAVRDVTDERRAQEIERRKMEVEDMLLKVSSMLVGAADVNSAVTRTMAEVGRYADARRVYIFQTSRDRNRLDMTHEWCAPGVPSVRTAFQGLALETFAEEAKELWRKAIPIPPVDAGSDSVMPAAWHEHNDLWTKYRVEIPLDVDGGLVGLLGFEHHIDGRAQEEDQVMLRQIFSEVLEAALERDRAVRTMEQSERYMRALFEATQDAVFIADVNTGVIVDANTRGEEMLGRGRGQIIGMHQTALHPPEKAELYAQYFKKYAAETTGGPINLEVFDARGRVIPVEVSFSTVEVDGRILLQGVFRNIEDKIRAEDALISERNRAEFYRDLVVKDVSLNNDPLVSHLESVLQRDDIADETREALEVAHYHARALGKVVSRAQDLLAMAGDPDRMEAVDVNALIAQAIERLLIAHPEDDIRVTVRFDAEVTFVEGNELLLDVFRNILEGAVERASGGRTFIDVECETDREGGSMAIRFKERGDAPEGSGAAGVAPGRHADDGSEPNGLRMVEQARSVLEIVGGTLSIEDGAPDRSGVEMVTTVVLRTSGVARPQCA